MNSSMSNSNLSSSQQVKKISLVLILSVFALVSFSCAAREEQEIKELMSVVFEGELRRGEEVIVFAEAA